MKDKKLIAKYPFLITDGDFEYTEYDNMPKGWRIAFGELLLNDIKEVLEKYNCMKDFRIDQIKEKYGSLRFYYSGICGEAHAEISRIIAAYEIISENVCVVCGKLDVPQTKCGWIEPICKDCWNGSRYEELVGQDSTIATSYIHRTYNAKDGSKEQTIDIGDYVNKVREYNGFGKSRRNRCSNEDNI